MSKIAIRVFEGDLLAVEADVLALKYAQFLYGSDGAVVERFSDAGRRLRLPEPWEVLLENSAPGIRSKRVLFVGVPVLQDFGYREIRMFASKVLSALSRDAPDTRRVAITAHGPGYGLDEVEAFEAEINGLLEAIREGNVPRSLQEIRVIERNPARARRFRNLLLQLLPEGAADLDGVSQARGASAADSRDTVSPPAKVVFPLHGIRTAARWRDAFHGVAVNRGWNVRLKPWYFGNFSTLMFLLSPARASKIRWFRDTYQTEMKYRDVGLKEGELPSIVAHSFGTYILGYALLTYPFIRFNKVLLCGSILPKDFPWEELVRRGQVQAVRNEYGVRDVWASVVSWFVRGSGPSGVLGFLTQTGDRFEQERFDYPHSEYFSDGHMESYWIPFLEKPIRQLPPTDAQAHYSSTARPWGLYAALAGIALFAAFTGYRTLEAPDRLLANVFGLVEHSEPRSASMRKLAAVVRSAMSSDGGFRSYADQKDPERGMWTSAQCIAALSAARMEDARDEIRRSLAFVSKARVRQAWGSLKDPIVEITAWAGLAYLHATEYSQLWESESERQQAIKEVQRVHRYLLQRQSSQGGWGSYETVYTGRTAFTEYSTIMAMRFLLRLRSKEPYPMKTAELDERISRGLTWILDRYDRADGGWSEFGSAIRPHKDLATMYLLVLAEADQLGFGIVKAHPNFSHALDQWIRAALSDSINRPIGQNSELRQAQDKYDSAGKLETGSYYYVVVSVLWHPWSLLLASRLAEDTGIPQAQRDKIVAVRDRLLKRVPEAVTESSTGFTYKAAETLLVLASL